MLDHIIGASKDLESSGSSSTLGSPLVNRTIDQAQIRSRSGASIVAMSRADRLMTNPGPGETLLAGDRLALIGTPNRSGESRNCLSEKRLSPRAFNMKDMKKTYFLWKPFEMRAETKTGGSDGGT